MKKLLLLFLVLAAGMMNANAAEDLYLQSNLTNWENVANWKLSGSWDGSQDVYSIDVPASVIGSGNFEFKFYRTKEQDVLGAYNGDGDYVFQFANGQNETYEANGGGGFVGSTKKYIIDHSNIQANSYRITLYVKYPANADWQYYIKVEIVDMPITIGASGFSTLVSDRALDFTGTVIKAYTAEDAGLGNATLNTITLAAANTPMLLHAAAGTYNVPVIQFNSGTTPSVNAFKAGQGTTVASEEGDFKNYILNSGTFYLANDKTVATNKAYLQLGASNTSKANLIFPNGDATSISSIMGEGEGTNVYYNLQGMQVSNPTKGMYIVNGKKYIVK